MTHRTTSPTLSLIRREWAITEPELERVLAALAWYADQPNGQRAMDVLADLSVACGREEYHRGYSDGYHAGMSEATEGWS